MAVVTADEALEHLNISDEHEDELQRFIDAATAHIERNYGDLPSGTYTESLPVVDDGEGTYRRWLHPQHAPVLTVTSATDEGGTTYSTGFTISPSGLAVRHDSVLSGTWTVVYTAGESETPADLKLAALEDIRGLWQPGQIGPPAEFGAFGIEATDVGPTFRPVRMWPRLDAWIKANRGPNIA